MCELGTEKGFFPEWGFPELLIHIMSKLRNFSYFYNTENVSRNMAVGSLWAEEGD